MPIQSGEGQLMRRTLVRKPESQSGEGKKMPTNPELRRNTRQDTPIATKQKTPIATKQATPRDNSADQMRSAYNAFRKQAKKR